MMDYRCLATSKHFQDNVHFKFLTKFISYFNQIDDKNIYFIENMYDN